MNSIEQCIVERARHEQEIRIETQHSEQPENMNDTSLMKKVDSNTTPDSSNMCNNKFKDDQNADDHENEMEKEDLVMATKSLVDDLDTFITKLNFDDHATNGSNIATAGVLQSVHNKVSSSFVSILQNKPLSKVVKITKMRNKEVVEGAAVALLMPWRRRSTYARALIEVHADRDLKESIVIAIPLGPHKGHFLATIDIEYEWKPSWCLTCLVFDHTNDKCSKLPKEVSIKAVDNDGFAELHYRCVERGETSKSSDMPSSTERVDVVVPKPNVTLKNSFSSLGMDDMDVEQDPEVGKDFKHVLNVSDSEVDEEIILDDRNGKCISDIKKGASTLVDFKVEKKEVFCYVIYAHNRYTHRRALWKGLSHHKLYVCNHPWCLMGNLKQVMDVNNYGLRFTWNQNPKGTNGILKKLDRVMANLEFNEDFMGVHAIFKPYRLSNHSSLVLTIPIPTFTRPKPFKVFNILTRNDQFKEESHEAALIEEHFLKKKAKIQWIKEGDSNSSYFHKTVKSRVSRSRIDVITNNEGTLFENKMVADVFVSHYEMFLGQAGITRGFNNDNLFKSCLDNQIALDMVRVAWDIVANDATDTICEIFTNGKLLKELNHTIIALNPKVKSPLRVNDYRPISCCNVLFKCISKIIANRIKQCLKYLVSPNQSAFVPGRSISNNILLTQELMHNYHLDRGTPRCAFKVDIQKAYDTVDWDFLQEVLYGFGFHTRMIAWIMECVSTTSYSICINGSLHGYFQGKRGLHQGDPLSLYLFTLIMETLTLMIQRRVLDSGSFTYHKYCSRLELINLCFTDDLFLFANGDVQSVRVTKEAQDKFKHASGLIPSLPKSMTYFYSVLNHTKISILNVLPFEEGQLPVKYLEVPLVSSRLMIRDCKELVEKIQIRIQDWKNKSLSIAAHEGFLWSHGSKGKAKVAWEVICLPKDEGGLGIRRLEYFNSTLMVANVWKLSSLKESLWVKWIHEYKLKGRSFWDTRLCGNIYWGWRKILVKIGYGSSTSLWFDHWCDIGPLSALITTRAISCAGLDLSSKGSLDRFEWRAGGVPKPFSVSNVWNSIRPRDDKVNWYALVWYASCIPQHAFNIWLIIKRKFKTQDLVRVWDASTSLGSVYDGLGASVPNIYSILSHLLPLAKRRSMKIVIAKLTNFYTCYRVHYVRCLAQASFVYSEEIQGWWFFPIGVIGNSLKHVSFQLPKEFVGLNDMVHNYYLEKAKKKSQLQKDKALNPKPSMITPARLTSIANGSKPKPRNSYQQPRNWPPPMSGRVTNKVVYKAKKPRNQKPFLKSKDLACPTYRKCIYSANRDQCILKYLSKIPIRKSVDTCYNTNDSASPLGKETPNPNTTICANSSYLSAGTSKAFEPISSQG
uniref:Reverse transcriptase domain-containing protein n=1 Tax=Tanacetum cinerariifolium TaxID=118510 RepID=A0A699HAS3_TANCI|nr:hypothetical protein [Tanacetum cinerariifolium]